MRFPPSFLDELRARLPVSEVVGRKVRLKKQGREWRGLSPFNKERTPSFFVNDQKGFYHDFSSGKHGDIFNFVMETEGLTFFEAVERLASLAGLALPAVSAEESAREDRRKSLHEVLELAAKFFEATLASRLGARARGYLSDRGISQATQLEFRIGYAPPDRFALKEHLGSLGVPVADMVDAGLLIAGEDIPVPYDRFRDRVIIPIHDQRGRVVGFGGRTLRDDVQPKYLNSPETAVFHKGSTVFNFHRARQPAHDSGSVVVVEGYMDAISVYQAGLKSVVATMGTAFTEEQVGALWRLSTEPIVCFDGDQAGISAAHRAIDRILPLLRVGRTFRFAFLQTGKDPDELIRNKGLPAFKEVLAGSLPLWEVLWDRETAAARIDSPDARAALEHRLYAIVRTIADPGVQTAYHRTCRVELSDLFWEATRGRRPPESPRDSLAKQELRIPREGFRHGIQKVLLGLFVHYPEFTDDKQEDMAHLRLDADLDAFRAALYDLLILNGQIDVGLIYSKLPRVYFDILDDVHGEKRGDRPRGHRLFARFPVVRWDPPPGFVSDCIDLFIEMLLLEQNSEEIRRMEAELGGGDDPDIDDKVTRFSELVRDHQLRRERVNSRDIALAEEAKEIKRLGEPADFRMPGRPALGPALGG